MVVTNVLPRSPMWSLCLTTYRHSPPCYISSYFRSKNKYCRDIVITVKHRKTLYFYLEAKVVKLSLVLYDDTLAKA